MGNDTDATDGFDDQQDQEDSAFRYYFVKSNGTVAHRVAIGSEALRNLLRDQAGSGGLASLVTVIRPGRGFDTWVAVIPNADEPVDMKFSTTTDGGVLAIKVAGKTVKAYGPTGWIELDVDQAIETEDDV